MSSRPSWEIIASLWLHLSLGAMLVLGERCAGDDAPLFKPEDVMRVQMATMQKSAVTQRATRAPEPAATTVEQPQTPPTPAPTTASEMVLHTEQDAPEPVEEPPKPAEKTPPQSEAPSSGQTSREQLLQNLSAPEGTTDRAAGSPDGVEGAVGDIIGFGEADPELAAWMLRCKEAILPNWSPLPATVAAHPEYVVQILVSVAADGRLSNPKIYKGTGDRSFDRAAQMAVIKTRSLPPPPNDWKASASKGVLIELPAKDKL